MKILYICFEFTPEIGGGSTYNKNLTDSLSKEGVQVIVFTSGENEVLKVNNTLTLIRSKNIKNIYQNTGDYLKVVDDLIKIIKDYKPDAIQTQQYIETLVAQVANKNFMLPLVVTHHKTPEYSNNTIFKNSKWSYFDYVNNDSVDYYISSSNTFTKSLLQSLDPININKIIQIYPGIGSCFKKLNNQEELNSIRRKIGIKEDDKLILLPLKIRRRKGLEFVLDVLQKYIKENQSSNIKVLITAMNRGNPYPELIITKYNENLGDCFINHNFSFTENEMVQLYNIASIAILPSQSEGLGLALIEAMSSGCPVIGTDVQGIYEVIDNDINGILVKFNDINAMYNAIYLLLNNGEKRSLYIKNAFIKVEKVFNQSLQAKKHIDVYSNIINLRKISCGGVLFRHINTFEFDIFLCTHESNGYVLPKGGVKKGETLIECANREILEETGYSVINPTYSLGSLSYKFNDKKGEFQKKVFFFAYEITNQVREELSLEEGEKISGGEWYTLDKAISLVSHESEKDKLTYLKEILFKYYDNLKIF
jgi:glycosyltransferase involved in cell wall biosynthesis/8-oxo-dGTP pyrophosphatase MutT (NUDIX family)